MGAPTSRLSRTLAGLATAGLVSIGLLALTVLPAGAIPSFAPAATLSASAKDAVAPQVAVDAAGDAVAVWELRAKGAHNTIVQARTRAANGSWSSTANLSATGKQATGSRVAVDAAGDAVAVWWVSNGSGAAVVQAAARPAGGSWSPPANVSAVGQYAVDPQVAVNSVGDATVVWRSGNASNSVVQWAFRPFGGSWSVPINLSAVGQNAVDPQVAVDGAGDAVVVWDGFNNGDSVVQAATRLAGGPFSAPVSLAVTGHDANMPKVAVDYVGNAVVVWERTDGTSFIVQGASRPARGSWTTPVNLSAPGQKAGAPQLAMNRNGDAVVVWDDILNHAVQVATGGVGAGPWSAPVTLSAAGRNADAPRVALDYAGSAVALWEQNDNGHFTVQAANGSTRNGSWSAPVNVASTGTAAPAPHVAVDPTGVAVAVWNRSNGAKFAVQAAIGLPDASVSPSTLAFPNTSLGSVSLNNEAVTIQNTGNALLRIGQVTLGGANRRDFSFVGSNCSARDLAVQDSCTVVLHFAPTATGPRSALLRINDNAAGSPHTVTISGTGTRP